MLASVTDPVDATKSENPTGPDSFNRQFDSTVPVAPARLDYPALPSTPHFPVTYASPVFPASPVTSISPVTSFSPIPPTSPEDPPPPANTIRSTRRSRRTAAQTLRGQK